jgi:hypothetical protein
MKRTIIISILAVAILTGCTRDIWERIDEIDQHLTELETQLQQQNESIVALYTLFNAVKSRDFITGITQLEGNAGYVVHFSRFDDIVIYHGTDAHVPRVGIKRNPSDGNYYWTIQYGNGEAQYIINDTGNMISAVGMVPLLKIDHGKFYISYDSRQTWQYIGEADGKDGDTIFDNIIVTNDYITFVTMDEEFKIPTNRLVQTLSQNAQIVNSNMTVLSGLINGLVGKDLHVTSVSDVVAQGTVIGSEVKLSNGYIFVVSDWVDTNVPMISAEKGEGDEVYYWAVIYSDGTLEWIRDKQGHRVAATAETVEIPTVVPLLDTTENVYYWNSVFAGDTTFVKDTHGNKVIASSAIGEFAAFKSVENNSEYLKLTLANGTVYMIPKAYTLSLSEETISLAPGAQKTVNYRVFGADETAQYTLLTQGDLTASRTATVGDVGAGTITIEAKNTFTGNGKVLLLVSAASGSIKTAAKTINVNLATED